MFQFGNGIRFMVALPEPSPRSGAMDLWGGCLGPPRETHCHPGKIGRPPYTIATPSGWQLAQEITAEGSPFLYIPRHCELRTRARG